jgi:hypothetical protein
MSARGEVFEVKASSTSLTSIPASSALYLISSISLLNGTDTKCWLFFFPMFISSLLSVAPFPM